MTALESVVDIESSCGYLTLVTKTNEDADSERNKEEATANKKSKASDSKQEIRETSPDGAELNSSNAQLLGEELDNIDCPMAGSMSKSSTTVPSRPKDLQLGEKLKPLEEVCSWQVLDITFGIPLFDMDLNAAVTKR